MNEFPDTRWTPLNAAADRFERAWKRAPKPRIEDVLAETRETYSGPLAVGEDLMAFEVGETVTVRRHQPPLSAGNPAKVA